MQNSLSRKIHASLLAPLLLTASAVYAQSSNGSPQSTSNGAADAAQSSSQLQEITVTAQKRDESLQRVPVAVSVVSETGLAAAGVGDIGEINMAIPALNTANGLGFLQFYLHGIGSQGNGIGFENPVALYVDGVYIATQDIGIFAFNNIAQIEVDKGPQGTLFGRNATGGLIQITTLDPTQETHVKAALGVSNYHGVSGSLYASGGIATDLAADIAISASRRDGWGTNLFNGEGVYAVPYDVAIRSKWIYKPDDWKFTFIADYEDTLSSNNADSLVVGSRIGSGTGPVGAPVSYPNPWDTNTNVQPQLRITSGGASFKIEHDSSLVTISDLAAGRFNNFDDIADYDASPVPGTGLNIGTKDWQFSNEFQVATAGTGPFRAVGGLYYFRERGNFVPDAVSIGGVIAPNNVTIPAFTVAIHGVEDTQAEAAFAQASYELVPSLTLTLGARYSFEQRSTDGYTAAVDCSLPAAFCPPPVLAPLSREATTFDKPTYRIALDYQVTPEMLTYVSFNTGFKSGGYNATSPGTAPYNQETITAYEAGLKADLLNRTLRVNEAAFYDNYKDIQSQVAGVTSTNFTNGGSAHIFGLDSDITAFPIAALQLNASLALLRAYYYNFPDAQFGAPGGGFPVGSGDARGNTLAHAPKATVTLGASYPFAVSDGTLTLNGNVYHNTGYYLEADNIVRQNGYTTENSSVEWSTSDEHLSIRLYANNISNQAVKSIALTIPNGNQATLLDAPRTYGVTFGYKFK